MTVNFSTSKGHDSVNRLACETISAPNAAMMRKVSNNEITIATILLIFLRTKKFTTGWSRIAIIIAKTIGIIITLAMYNIANKEIVPTKKIVALA
jgi:xanthine/uracil permease